MTGLILAAMLLAGARFVIEGLQWLADDTEPMLLRLGAGVSIVFGLWAVTAAAGMLD